MRRLIRRVLEITVLPTIALGIAVLIAPSRAPLAFHLWLLVVAGIGLVALVTAAQGAIPARPSVFGIREDARGEMESRFSSLARLERAVSMATASGYDVHHRLRPPLREIAAGLLLVHRGIDLDRQPESARAVLGDPTWELVRAERERPQSRREPGLDAPQLEVLVSSLENL